MTSVASWACEVRDGLGTPVPSNHCDQQPSSIHDDELSASARSHDPSCREPVSLEVEPQIRVGAVSKVSGYTARACYRPFGFPSCFIANRALRNGKQV